jgi:NADPH:quinone reductase-like Zn-dependent oxidoreductase
MKAITLKERGKEGVVLESTNPPLLKTGSVLIRVKAASLNQVDIYMRDNGLGIRHTLPQIMGVDCVGEVVEAVPDSQFKVGDNVILYPYEFCGQCSYCLSGEQQYCDRAKIFGEHIDGTFAEIMSVPETSLFHLSSDADPLKAASLGVAYLTAWRMLLGKAKIRPGQTVLIMGGGGGVATAALDLAMMTNCKTIVTTSDAGKASLLSDAGADYVINYKTENVVDEVKSITSGKGVDVVIDNVGQATWDASLKCATKGGVIVTCGATTGSSPSADLQRLFIRQLSVFGSTMGNVQEFKDLLSAFEQNKLFPIIDSVYSLDEFSSAFERLEHPDRVGKVIFQVS